MAREFTALTDQITQGTVSLPLTGSMAFWIYPTWAQNDAVDHFFYDVSITQGFFQLEHFSDNFLYLGWNTSSTDYQVVVDTLNYTLNQNAWNHFAFTWDNTAAESKAYLNGAQIGATKATLVAVSTAGNIRSIGNHHFLLNVDCRSRISEFAIWRMVLSASEVLALYMGRLSPLFIRRAALTDYLPMRKRTPNVGGYEENLIGPDHGVLASGTVYGENPVIIYPGSFNIPLAPFDPVIMAAIFAQMNSGGYVGRQYV